jgi:hypothetical protein
MARDAVLLLGNMARFRGHVTGLNWRNRCPYQWLRRFFGRDGALKSCHFLARRFAGFWLLASGRSISDFGFVAEEKASVTVALGQAAGGEYGGQAKGQRPRANGSRDSDCLATWNYLTSEPPLTSSPS